MNLLLQPGSQDFGENLDRAVLEGNWAEICWGGGGIFLWQEHDVRSVEAVKLCNPGMEVIEEMHHILLHCMPRSFVETQAQAIRTGSTI